MFMFCFHRGTLTRGRPNETTTAVTSLLPPLHTTATTEWKQVVESPVSKLQSRRKQRSETEIEGPYNCTNCRVQVMVSERRITSFDKGGGPFGNTETSEAYRNKLLKTSRPTVAWSVLDSQVATIQSGRTVKYRVNQLVGVTHSLRQYYQHAHRM